MIFWYLRGKSVHNSVKVTWCAKHIVQLRVAAVARLHCCNGWQTWHTPYSATMKPVYPVFLSAKRGYWFFLDINNGPYNEGNERETDVKRTWTYARVCVRRFLLNRKQGKSRLRHSPELAGNLRSIDSIVRSCIRQMSWDEFSHNCEAYMQLLHARWTYVIISTLQKKKTDDLPYT